MRASGWLFGLRVVFICVWCGSLEQHERKGSRFFSKCKMRDTERLARRRGGDVGRIVADSPVIIEGVNNVCQ